jgi:hypothetical protein
VTTDVDTTRIVRSWLHEDAHESAERLLDEVVAALGTTPQHRSRWPAWRVGSMNVDAKLGMYAAAVLAVVALVMNLLPAGGGMGVGGRGASSSPSTNPSLGPSASAIADIWTTGTYEVGRHEATMAGLPFSFEVPAVGWSGNPTWTGMLSKQTSAGGLELGWVGFTWSFDMVATDPCHGGARSVGPSVDDLATAITTIPGIEAIEPADTTVAGLPSKVVEFTINDDIDCAPSQFMLYGPASAFPNSTDSTIKDWIFEVDGDRNGIHADVVGDDPELWAEIQEIVDSVRFE